MNAELNYSPMPGQEAFHNSKAPARLLLGGCRAGKSTALFREIGRFMRSKPNGHVLLLAGPPQRPHPYRQLFETVPKDAMQAAIDQSAISSVRWIDKNKLWFDTVTLKNGATISLRDALLNPFESAYHLVAVDEQRTDSTVLCAHNAVMGGANFIGAFSTDGIAMKISAQLPGVELATFRLLFSANPYIDEELKRRMMGVWASQSDHLARTRITGHKPNHNW